MPLPVRGPLPRYLSIGYRNAQLSGCLESFLKTHPHASTPFPDVGGGSIPDRRSGDKRQWGSCRTHSLLVLKRQDIRAGFDVGAGYAVKPKIVSRQAFLGFVNSNVVGAGAA